MQNDSVDMPLHLLVTGGAGFIGSNFVHYVAEHYPSVAITVLDSLTYAGNIANLYELPTEFFNNKYSFIKGDVRDSDLVDSILNPFAQHKTATGLTLPAIDAIVHFASESHNDNAIECADPFITTNVYGTYVLLNAARKYNIRFHHISTDEVYGGLPIGSEMRFNEESPYNPSSPYAASKASSDHLVRAWYKTYGVRATISNCGNNYGPRQHIEKFIPRQITNIMSGIPAKLYGKGDSVREWIHVEDHCDAIWRVLTRGTIGETYVVGTQCELSNIDMLKIILRIMGVPESNIEYVNPRLGEDKRYALDSSKIRSQLEWEPKHSSINIGIQDTINWYASHFDMWNSYKNIVENHYAKSGH
ncbi:MULTISPECIES: dTDP-glucose 4,6-dehydratase [Gardnerella]|uniref:dTDP-glucose 4,6-dehydratase n=1 Tax=Gardnerella vaginalis TaxID=2702 RepID=A0A135Z7U5_GARVA|nr:dTDP-glucose 4,6-dehydratase [Gardnerella vaginalis]